MEFFGYTGKICRLNLSNENITIEELDERDLRRFLGCSGYAAKMLWDQVGPKLDPLSPESKIIFATGPLTGSLCPSGGSYELCFKSPLTHTWCQARSGGSFGPRLKMAGFDHLVVEGKSGSPVYIWVNDGQVEIRDATHLWGVDVKTATDIIMQEIGDKDASVAAIGPAGENQVRFAAVINDFGRAAARGGGGAIMGSKNLKAIAVNGKRGIRVAHPQPFKLAVIEAEQALNRYQSEIINQFGTPVLVEFCNLNGSLPTKYFQYGTFEKFRDISWEKLTERYLIKRRACFGCPMGCGRYTNVDSGKWLTPPGEGPEYETISMLGSLCLNSDLESILRANHLCNNLGMDTISTGAAIAFAMECFEKGIITKDDLDGSDLHWADSDAVVQLVEKIAFRKGIGDRLANGIMRAAETFGPEAQDLALHTKGMDLPAHEPRAESTLLGLQYAVSPRGACHMHPNNIAIYDEDEALWDPGLKAFGRPWPPAPKHAEVGFKKGVLYRLVSLQGEISEILGCCIFHSWGSEGRCLTPQLYSEMFRSLTGIDMTVEELMNAAERSWNLKRCFNLREGFLRKDDNLPKRMFQPLPDGPAKGEHFKNLDGMLDEYYDAFGWDRITGGPKFETLLRLDMEDIAKAFSAG